MRYITIVFLAFFLYLSCGNNSKRILSVEEFITKALSNDTIIDGWRNKTNRIELLEAIKNADKEGLIPEDYNFTKLKAFEDKLILFPEAKEEYHKLLTVSYIKYVSDLKNGKVNPNEIYNDWEIEHKEIQPDSLLLLGLQKKKIDSTIEASKPNNGMYKGLKKALQVLNQMPKDSFTEIKLTSKLIFGKTNKQLPAIKERLRYWGDLEKTDTLSNEMFDKTLKEAVIKFQKRHGLLADGAIGKGTIAALNFNLEQRKQQVITNLERWRWFPSDLGTNYLGVNLPNFMLYVVENGDTIKDYRVVVGQTKRRTPILSSKVDNIVFNPTWTVPPTIIKEDLVPDATKSKSYFSKTRLKIFDYKNNEIPVWKWKAEDANKYKYVQDPGYNNALGVVKINFSNKHLVYMHDTNHRDLFGGSYRALSSGCVRVQTPLPLAEYLLKDKLKKLKPKATIDPKTGKTKPIIDPKTGKAIDPKKLPKFLDVPIYSLAEIDTIVKTKKTTTVKVSQNYGVHFLYFTAWYDKGTLQFRNDIYQYDSDLYCRLTNQLTSNLVSSSRMINK